MLEKSLKIFLSILICLTFYQGSFASETPDILGNITFQEFTNLSNSKIQPEPTKSKVFMLLNTPFVENKNIKHRIKKSTKIGPYIRVASWNLGRGHQLERIQKIFTSSASLIKELQDPEDFYTVVEQLKLISNSDIIVLNEVDIGMPRTKYKNIVKEIAKAGGYNFAYGVEFLEVDPCHLGLEDYFWSEENLLQDTLNIKKIDKERYKGLHGNAILSKFPIMNVEIIRLPKVYDWYHSEKEKISFLEEIRRTSAKKILKEGVLREIRVGGRIALVADIKIPNLNTPVTVVSTHIENRTEPKNRKKQLEFLLNKLKEKKNPIILAGDFNTTMKDGSSISVTKTIKQKLTDVHFIGKAILLDGNPYALLINSSSYFVNFIRSTRNPTSLSIPFFAPNPEHGFFKLIKNTKFKDGYYFDTRGDKERSINGKGTFLANSNDKGYFKFKPTFIFQKHYGLAKYKLDWIFVKAYYDKSNKKASSSALAPHFGRTLYELNYYLKTPLSDHAPITVDLPLTDYSNAK